MHYNDEANITHSTRYCLKEPRDNYCTVNQEYIITPNFASMISVSQEILDWVFVYSLFSTPG